MRQLTWQLGYRLSIRYRLSKPLVHIWKWPCRAKCNTLSVRYSRVMDCSTTLVTSQSTHVNSLVPLTTKHDLFSRPKSSGRRHVARLSIMALSAGATRAHYFENSIIPHRTRRSRPVASQVSLDCASVGKDSYSIALIEHSFRTFPRFLFVLDLPLSIPVFSLLPFVIDSRRFSLTLFDYRFSVAHLGTIQYIFLDFEHRFSSLSSPRGSVANRAAFSFASSFSSSTFTRRARRVLVSTISGSHI